MRQLTVLLLAPVLASALAACSSSAEPAHPAPTGTTDGTRPATGEPEVDHGAPSATYPAFTPDMPRLQNKGGRVLASPVIVTVTLPGETHAETLEALGDAIGTTAYWRAIVSEYGVGPATSGPEHHVRDATSPPASGRGEDPVLAVERWLGSRLGDTATSKWPAPTDDSLYIMYLAGGAATQLCDEGAGGLHGSIDVSGKQVAYALVLDCDGTLESETISASHELAEAAVDPYPDTSPAWQGVDDDHLAWDLMVQAQDENGDLCEIYDEAYGAFAAPQIASQVQRQWSNASAAAGHAPCVPAGATPYFNVVPFVSDVVTANLAAFQFPGTPRSRGLRVDVGETKTIALGVYSDGPTDAIAISAFEIDPLGDMANGPFSVAATSTVTLSLDRDHAVNGEKVYLSVKADARPALGASVVLVATKAGGETHYAPVLVGGP
jgi:hypothetical protein